MLMSHPLLRLWNILIVRRMIMQNASIDTGVLIIGAVELR
jgi:hypothetical protein